VKNSVTTSDRNLLKQRALINVVIAFMMMCGLVTAGSETVHAAGECAAGWTFDSVNFVCKYTVSSTASEVTVTVPSGVSVLTVTVTGGAGARGGRNSSYYGDSNRGFPGDVGQVTGTLAVTPSTSLKVAVGGAGSEGATGCGSLGYCGGNGSGGPGGTSAVAGYGGGAGAWQAPADWSGGGGGGGAATILKVANSIYAIAGGGGGGGGGAGYSSGGNGTTNNSYVGNTAGANGVQLGGDGGGAGGGGGGYHGGTAGVGGGGDNGGSGGNAGQNLVPATWTGSYVSAASGSVEFAYAPMPTNTVAPSVPSSVTATNAVTASAGTWTAVSSYAYQWLLCDQQFGEDLNISGALVIPNGCTAISGANSASITPTVGMIGQYLRLAVTGSNSTGTLTSISATGAATVGAPATLAPDLVSASDLGISSTDNLTNDTTPEIAVGGLQIGATVAVTATSGGNTSTCTFVATATTGTCTLPNLADGVWTVSSTQEIGGVVSAPTSTTITIDATRPTAPAPPDLVAASDTGSSSTDDITTDATPTILVPGVTNGLTVTVTASRSGAQSVSCSYVAAVNATGCDLPALTDGEWNLVATTSEVDNAGNAALPSSALPITIRTAIGGVLGVDVATASDSGVSALDNLTKFQTIDVGAGLTPNGSSVVVTATRSGYSNVTCSYVASSTTNSCALGVLADGVWDIAATVTDPVVNITQNLASLPVTIDSVAPADSQTPDLNSFSDTGISQSDNLTRDNTPRIDVAGVATGNTVTVRATKLGAASVQCTFVASATVSGCDLDVLADGEWSITSTVADAAGNTSPASPALSVEIDTATYLSSLQTSIQQGTSNVPQATRNKVVIPDLLAKSDSGVSNSDNVTIEHRLAISVPDAQVGEIVKLVAIGPRGAELSCTYVASAAVNSCELGDGDAGLWRIIATVTDRAGNAYTSETLSATISDVDGLPAVDKSEVKSSIATQGSVTTVKVGIPKSAGSVAAQEVVIAVLNSAGKVIRRTAASLTSASRTVSFTMPASADATRVVAYVANVFGVSRRAPIGSNVARGVKGLVCQGTGVASYLETSLTDRVVFDAASPVLDAEDKKILNRVATYMKNRGGQIVITGMARKNGIDSMKFLMNLSLERARNVAMYLSSNGVRSWINYDGFGAVTKQIGTPVDRRVDVCWSSQPSPTNLAARR
jgi:outer membrane protein OmpA-like peptidoglycan-associated protein